MNLKPFNLERALAGDPVITREGRKVIRIAHFPEASLDEKLQVLIEDVRTVFPFTETGYRYPSYDSKYDLFMAPKTKTYHVNVYKNDKNTISVGYVCESLEEAKKMKTPINFIKTISFELEE